MRKPATDRGAAAVEFAILLLPLSILTLGILAFGNAFHIQTVLDNAARDAVRVYTLTPGAGEEIAETAARASARLSVLPGELVVTVEPTPCTAGGNARVTVAHELDMVGGFFGSITLTGSGTMRCAG